MPRADGEENPARLFENIQAATALLILVPVVLTIVVARRWKRRMQVEPGDALQGDGGGGKMH